MFTGNARFRVEGDPIGMGGMGVVYRVFDSDAGRYVALKTLPSPDQDLAYTLKKEFRLLVGLSHKNLIRLHELFVEGETCYFTMELIDGGPFSERLRKAAEPRLRDSLRQLVHGLSTLHQAGTLHCDVKPSNVMLTAGDRVVLLDFGLSVLWRRPRPSSDDSVGGTYAYMAPEQFWGRTRDPAIDWYGVGALLYETLTGIPPFRGPPARIMQLKQMSAPPAPHTLVSGVPDWLDKLVTELMHPDPAKRPGAAEILARIGEKEGGPHSLAPPPADLFVGRAAELARLREGLDAVTSGAMRITRVRGPSGIGKTALIERFIWDAARSDATILRGRCHVRESVPYKAIDPIVDELSRHLLHLRVSGKNVQAFVPADLSALVKVFPILASVPGFRPAPPLETGGGEPGYLRRRAFAAFRELIAALAKASPLILCVDDFQWADADSLALLRSLVAPPDPPRLLLLLAHRSEDEETSEALKNLEETPLEAGSGSRIEIVLQALAPEDSVQLARAHLGFLAAETRDTEIARESGGSPLLIGALARHALLASGKHAPAAVSPRSRLERVVQAHVAYLSADECRVLETVAVAAIPLPETLIAGAAGSSGSDSIHTLCNHCLLRRSAEAAGRVTVYHDRIRDAVVGTLDPERLRERHQALAETLSAGPDPDPDALVTHFLGAGRPDRAGEFAIQAAARAADALAFGQAAELYALVLELLPDDPRRADWTIRLAEALAHAGRGGESAARYQEAARLKAASGDGEVLSLKREAANQYMRSGHLDAGMSAIREVLARVGVELPPGEKQAASQALRLRLKLLLRGKKFTLQDVAGVEPSALLRLDAMWNATMNLSMMTPTYAQAVGGQHLLEALRLGERSRLIQALGMECSFEAAIGGRLFGPRAEKTQAVVVDLARGSKDPYDQAWTLLTRGSAAWHRGNWRESFELCDRAAEIFQSHCRGAAWEVGANRIFAYSSLSFLGDMKILSARVPADLAEATARGDLFASNHYRLGQLSLFRLAEDQVDEAMALAGAARREWPASMYSTHHYHHFTLMVQAHLYKGDPGAAWALIQQEWPKLKGAQFLLLGMVRAELSSLRARVAISAAAKSPSASRELLEDAEQCAKTIAGCRVTPAEAWADAARAGVASARGKSAEAARLYERAASGFSRAEMALYREAALLRAGEVSGADRDRGTADESRARMRALGIVKPDQMAAVLV